MKTNLRGAGVVADTTWVCVCDKAIFVTYCTCREVNHVSGFLKFGGNVALELLGLPGKYEIIHVLSADYNGVWITFFSGNLALVLGMRNG